MKKMHGVATNVYSRKMLEKPERGLRILKITVRELFTLGKGDVAPCGACRPWIFFINGFLYFLRSDSSGMEKEKDEWRCHFK